jgi:hypothetical protein
MLVSYKILVRDDVRSALFSICSLKGDKVIYTGIKAYQLMVFRKKYIEHYDACQESFVSTQQAFSVIVQNNGQEQAIVPPSRAFELKAKISEIWNVEVEMPDFEVTWSDCERMGLTIEERGGLFEFGLLKTFPTE